MRWGVKITDTTKMSVEVRWILCNNVHSTVRDLHKLRKRAIDRASPESLAAFAAGVPLPKPSDEEKSELAAEADDSSRVEHAWGEQISESATLSVNGSSEGISGWQDQDEDSFGEDLGGIDWDRTLEVDVAENINPWDDAEFLFKNDQEAPTRPPSPQNEPEAHPQSNGEAPKAKLTHGDKEQNPLMIPSVQTFPEWLRGYLDGMDGQTTNGATPHQEPPASGHNINAEHLLRLQDHIRHVEGFRDYLGRSIQDVSDALNRREDRYVMRENGAPLSSFMRSRGDGSPLVEGIAADERWPDDEEDNWGLPQVRAPRRKIYGCRELSKTAARAEDMPAAQSVWADEAASGEKTPQVAW